MHPYRHDLALVHDEGFGQLAASGAEALVHALRAAGLMRGMVVDCGCGSGITARHLADRGYAVMGVDVSQALVELARRRTPEASFHVKSYVDMDIPRCVAVCALGEVLNYTFDPSCNDTTRRAFFLRVAHAITPGGVFLFDVAGPGRAEGLPSRTFTEGQDWTVLAETSVEADILTRRITTFVRAGETYRHDVEVHRLRLVPPDVIEAELQSAGFAATRLLAYGEQSLPPGLHAFMARRL